MLINVGDYLNNDTAFQIESGRTLHWGGGAAYKGIEYHADYSANYVARSIPDVGYVTGLTSALGATAVTGATNGLTKVGKNAELGGTLTKNTTINVSTFDLKFSGDSVQYTTDYSGTYVARSLVDAGYVTGLTSGLDADIAFVSAATAANTADIANLAVWSGQTDADIAFVSAATAANTADIAALGAISGITLVSITGATNGLTKVGAHGVKLGGTQLSETTVIAGNSQVFSLTGLTDLNLGGTTVDLTGVVTLQTSPNTGAGTDAVLVWNSVDKQIKQIPASSLGEDNNDYSKTIVTGNTTLTTGSTYVILVNHTAPVTITLPAAPFDGQAFKIKDAANTALTYNITIGRNGKNIDRQASNAVINTDSGALELVYDATLGWFTLAFVN